METDRRTLEQIAACVHTQANPLKQTGFWSVASISYPEAADRTALSSWSPAKHARKPEKRIPQSEPPISSKYIAADDRKPRRQRGASLHDRRAP